MRSCLVATASLCLLLAGSACAETINFNGLSSSPTGTTFTAYTQNNFTVTSIAGNFQIGNSYGDPVPDLFVVGGSATINVAENAGTNFTFSGVDLAAFAANTFTITGLLNGVTVFTSNGAVTISPANGSSSDFAAYGTAFDSDLINDLRINLNNPTYESDLDNITVTRATATTPEPSSLLLLGTGLLGTLGAARRRLRA